MAHRSAEISLMIVFDRVLNLLPKQFLVLKAMFFFLIFIFFGIPIYGQIKALLSRTVEK